MQNERKEEQMAENQMSELIRTSLDGIRNFTGGDTCLGTPIETAAGVTVIPVSKVTVAFATGGVDYGGRRIVAPQNFGGGGGTGVTITPMAFLTVGADADIRLIPVADNGGGAVGKVADLIADAPDILKKIKDVLF